ncbi:MAG: tetratricopeptide repeat protein [Chitinophagales bacterium]|nr:tetratricopeptide repeat protein [Chitinophagales bacterium]
MNNDKLDKAIRLRSKKNFDDSFLILNELLNEYPNNADFHYHFAWLLDNMGNEIQAIEHYKLAIANNLNKTDLEHCFVGLISSYIQTNQFEKAKQTLEQSTEFYPKSSLIKVFESILCFKNNQADEAYKKLMVVFLENCSNQEIVKYAPALEYYTDNQI